jgi:hypothetical protein
MKRLIALAVVVIASQLKLGIVPIFFFSLIAGWAGTQQEAKVVEQPSVNTTEPWVITVGAPGWLAGASGHIGFRGVNPYVSVGVGEILKNYQRYLFVGRRSQERALWCPR